MWKVFLLKRIKGIIPPHHFTFFSYLVTFRLTKVFSIKLITGTIKIK